MDRIDSISNVPIIKVVIPNRNSNHPIFSDLFIFVAIFDLSDFTIFIKFIFGLIAARFNRIGFSTCTYCLRIFGNFACFVELKFLKVVKLSIF